MKRAYTSILFALILGTCIAAAQPRAMGLRAGVSGLKASYQHSVNNKGFIGADLGVDLGYNASCNPGAKFNVTYNFIWAMPAWTHRGTWALYGGPGIFAGAAEDLAAQYSAGEISGSIKSHGFTAGLSFQIGLEYEFRIPLHISLEVRPCFGIHTNKHQTGFYDNGLLGFVPSLAVRYLF